MPARKPPKHDPNKPPRLEPEDVQAEQDEGSTVGRFLHGLDKATRRVKPVKPPAASPPRRGSSRT